MSDEWEGIESICKKENVKPDLIYCQPPQSN
jgi:hypothetical protein